MKRWWFIWLVCLSGCSTAPFADFMDFCKPGRMGKDHMTPCGGVCVPGQGTLPIAATPLPPAPNLPSTPPVPVPVIPGPAPLPGPSPMPSGPAPIPPPPPPSFR